MCASGNTVPFESWKLKLVGQFFKDNTYEKQGEEEKNNSKGNVVNDCEKNWSNADEKSSDVEREFVLNAQCRAAINPPACSEEKIVSSNPINELVSKLKIKIDEDMASGVGRGRELATGDIRDKEVTSDLIMFNEVTTNDMSLEEVVSGDIRFKEVTNTDVGVEEVASKYVVVEKMASGDEKPKKLVNRVNEVVKDDERVEELASCDIRVKEVVKVDERVEELANGNIMFKKVANEDFRAEEKVADSIGFKEMVSSDVTFETLTRGDIKVGEVASEVDLIEEDRGELPNESVDTQKLEPQGSKHHSPADNKDAVNAFVNEGKECGNEKAEDTIIQLDEVGSGNGHTSTGKKRGADNKKEAAGIESVKNVGELLKICKDQAPVMVKEGCRPDSDSSGVNIVSIVLICGKDCFFKRMGGRGGRGEAMWMIFWAKLEDILAKEGWPLKDKSHSCIGNQIRMDFVFSEERHAKLLNNRLLDISRELLPNTVTTTTMLMSEADFGYNMKPVLGEKDILFLAKKDRVTHMFRLSVKCRVGMQGNQVVFRFNSLSDLNLFIYNRGGMAHRKGLGKLRIHMEELELVPDQSGLFKLYSPDTTLERDFKESEKYHLLNYDIRELKKGRYFCFHSKLDLFKFFTNKVTMAMNLEFEDNLVMTKVEKLNSHEQTIKDKTKCSENEVKIGSMRIELEQLKNQLAEVQASSCFLAVTGRTSGRDFLTLQDILGLEFHGETEANAFPACLMAFLRSSPILSLEEGGEGGLIFRYKDEEALSGDLKKWVKMRSAKIVEKNPQRAAVEVNPSSRDYELLVYLEESGLSEMSRSASTGINQVAEELKKSSENVQLRGFGFLAKFSSRLALFRTLLSPGPLRLHRLKISEDNLSYYSRGRMLDFSSYKGLPCLTERELLSLCCSMQGNNAVRKTDLSLILKDPRIHQVEVDWNGDLVIIFETEEKLNTMLQNQKTKRGRLMRQEPACSLVPEAGLFILECTRGQELNVRDFLEAGEQCSSLQPGKVASRSKVFLGRSLQNDRLREIYPTLAISKKNVRFN